MARGQFFDPILASEVLACAAIEGDKAACEQYSVAQRSVTRWRERMKTDRSLANQVTLKVNERRPQWHLKLPQAMADFIDCLVRETQRRQIDADSLRAIGEQFERLARIQMAMRIVDARLAVAAGGEGSEVPRSVPRLAEPDYVTVDPESPDSE